MDDFLIIGGGIAGASAAGRLAALGTVTLLEAEPALGYHASGRSAALFEATYGKPTTVALNRASHDFHATEDGGFLSPRGLMLVGTADEEEAFLRDLDLMEMKRVSVDDARGIVPILNPDSVSFAGVHDEAWDLDTDRMIQHFARRARGNGQVVTNAAVSGIERTPAGWRVRAGAHDYVARVLVNAAGV